ncbi:hypothetical protein BDR22DRAFT_885638 [Usnea florida]
MSQLSFTFTTSSKVKTAHLVGTWDGYRGQLPLTSQGSGLWKGTFRFSEKTLKPGSRYWYYYIEDGFRPTHDKSARSQVEPSTGRTLNILDVSKSSSASLASAGPLSTLSKRGSTYAPHTGRALSPSKIAHPKPTKPYESRRVREADYSTSPGMDDLAEHLEKTSLYKMRNISPPSSVGSSLSSRSSDRSSPSSLSSLSNSSSSDSQCKCQRYGVTRGGSRVKIDCGGKRCGYSDDSSSACSSIDSSSESESEEEYERKSRRREAKPAAYHESKSRYVEAKPRYQTIAPRGYATTGMSRGSRR